MEVCGLTQGELASMNKTDWRKAMIVRGIRKHSSVKLDWIAGELHMGVRSGVTRAEQMLKTRLEDDKQAQSMWRKMEKMRHFYTDPYSCPLFLPPIPL